MRPTVTAYDAKIHMTNALWARSISWLMSVGAVFMLALAIAGYRSAWVARVALLANVGMAVGAKVADRVARENELIIQDYRDIGDGARQDVLYAKFRSEVKPLPGQAQRPPEVARLPEAQMNPAMMLEPIEFFNWEEIAINPIEFPHMAIMSKSGAGKSVLAQWVSAKVGGVVIAADPHYEPGNYPTVTRIVGKGRNFGIAAKPPTIDAKGKDVPGEYPIDLRDIVDGEDCNCGQLMMAAVAEMARRYQLMAIGQYSPKNPDTPNVSLIMDEYNAYAKLPGMPDCLWAILQEARKVGIRLFLIVHAKEVAALGVEGKGSIRECLSFIRLKKAALDHCRLQLNSQVNNSPMQKQWYEVYQTLSSQERPAMIDETPAIVPNLKDWLERNIRVD